MGKLIALLKEEDGLETVEWAVIAAVIAVGLATAVATVGANVFNAFTNLQTVTAS